MCGTARSPSGCHPLPNCYELARNPDEPPSGWSRGGAATAHFPRHCIGKVNWWEIFGAGWVVGSTVCGAKHSARLTHWGGGVLLPPSQWGPLPRLGDLLKCRRPRGGRLDDGKHLQKKSVAGREQSVLELPIMVFLNIVRRQLQLLWNGALSP